jgi:3-keto-5-aminohexanoate cleavage enzyme
MAEIQAPDTRTLPNVRIRPANIAADRGEILAVLETVNMHHVPSSEMDDLDVGEWYVAEREGRIVGVAGYRLEHREGELVGKTTLLAVVPSQRAFGLGRSLQELRMKLMRREGATRVITNADRPETIAWYKRHFGYREIGSVTKTREFGLPEVDHWTTLQAPLT